jgi:CO/xanthine dehydrogenase Mo-binding subunit
VLLDAGAYATLSSVVLSRASLHAGGPYACEHVRIRGRAMATNTPPNGAFRGFGAPQAHFAIETHLDRVAAELGVSPLELRRRNAYRLGDTTPTGQVLGESVAAVDVLDRAAEATSFETVREWTARERAARVGSGALPASPLRTTGARHATGIGLALGWHGAGFTGSGEGGWHRSPRSSWGRRADRRPGGLDRDGAGDERILSGSVAAGWDPR